MLEFLYNIMVCRFLALLACLVIVVSSESADYLEYNYSVRRNALQEEERASAGYRYDYTEDEQIVYNYLEYLKWEEFNRTRDNFPPARPIKQHINEVKQSKIYKVLKTFPKGGNMHLHHNHVVSKSKILDIVMSSPLYDNLYVKVSEPHKWSLDLFINPPDGWVKVKDNSVYSKSVLLQHATLLGVMDNKALNEPTNAGLRWSEMNPLFSVIGASIVNQANVSKSYMEEMLRAALDENVQYLETKSSSYNKLYILDSDPIYVRGHGKHNIDNNDGELELQMVEGIVREFRKANPNFIGYKRIINSSRWRSALQIAQDAEQALRLHLKYPELVSGFDLVSEEDKGYSLLFYLKDFLQLTAKNVSLPYFFHTAETNWPEDLLTSSKVDDPVGTVENVYEAILLGAKRVGHGIGYLNHPYLMEILKKNKIAIEVNPVSNKMLGYVPDERHHPGITYIRYGIPVVLGSDDPATFGYDEFTVDWYEAFMGWGLNLADLRQLALNSLTYSSLSTTEKAEALQKWTSAWNIFVSNTKVEACAKTFKNTIPHVYSIFPNEGQLKGGTKVHVYGRNFYVSICKTIVCRFGNKMTNGTFVYSHMLSCVLPNHNPAFQPHNPKQPIPVPFSVSFDSGSTFTTPFTFTYLHENQITISEIVGK